MNQKEVRPRLYTRRVCRSRRAEKSKDRGRQQLARLKPTTAILKQGKERQEGFIRVLLVHQTRRNPQPPANAIIGMTPQFLLVDLTDVEECLPSHLSPRDFSPFTPRPLINRRQRIVLFFLYLAYRGSPFWSAAIKENNAFQEVILRHPIPWGSALRLTFLHSRSSFLPSAALESQSWHFSISNPPLNPLAAYNAD